MKAAIPTTVRAELEGRLPADLEVRWYAGPPEAEAAVGGMEIAWVDIFGSEGLAAVVEAGADLKWITTIQAGVNAWPFARMRERGLLFTNGKGISSVPMAEFVVMGMLAMAKDLKALMAYQHGRRWAPWTTQADDMAGARVLIVGYGAIGREIGRRLEAFDAEVVGVRRAPTDEPGVIGADGWRGRLGEFDWVVIAAASTEETRGLIGAAELAAMKPSARIVNIARGALIDQPALVEALGKGRIAGALLDVTEPEPPPADDPIWSAPNTLLTSHSSAMSTGWPARAAEIFLDNLARYRSGRPLRNLVDLDLGY